MNYQHLIKENEQHLSVIARSLQDWTRDKRAKKLSAERFEKLQNQARADSAKLVNEILTLQQFASLTVRVEQQSLRDVHKLAFEALTASNSSILTDEERNAITAKYSAPVFAKQAPRGNLVGTTSGGINPVKDDPFNYLKKYLKNPYREELEEGEEIEKVTIADILHFFKETHGRHLDKYYLQQAITELNFRPEHLTVNGVRDRYYHIAERKSEMKQPA